MKLESEAVTANDVVQMTGAPPARKRLFPDFLLQGHEGMNQGLGPTEGIVLAKLLKGSAVLTNLRCV